MTTTTKPNPTDTAPSVDAVRVAVDQLAPELRDRAPEIEAARGLPDDLLARLVDAGCFQLALPPSHGGAGATLADFLSVIAQMCRAEPSTGWLAMIGSGVWIDMAGLPPATFDTVVGDRNLLAGVFNPTGTAEPVDGGYRVTGRWAFASGCRHSRWIYGNCIEPGDPPRIRTAVFPTGDVEIEDTWHTLGMRGTGSHHFHVDGVFVPADRTCTDEDPRAVDLPLLRIPPPAVISLSVAAAAAGTAQGAVDEIAAIAVDRRPLMSSGSMATNPRYHHDLATAESDLGAIRASLAARADDLWATAEAGEPVSLDQRAETRAAAVWATTRAVAVVETAYRSGGGSAIYDDHPLQRRLRDVNTIAQHFLVRPDTMVTAGAVLAGQDLDVPVF